MSLEHKDVQDPDIHEPKGVASASVGSMYVSDGAGSGSWKRTSHGFFYYDNIGTGTTITTPVAYTLINPVTTADVDSVDFLHNGFGRMTYTGASSLISISGTITLKHSSSTLIDSFFQIFKNGVAVAGTQQVTASLSGNYQNISILAHVDLVTNDYIEVFTKTASGSVTIHSFSLNTLGVVK